MLNIDIVNILGADRGRLWSLSRRLCARNSSLLSSQVMFFNISLVLFFFVKLSEHYHHAAV